jgi:hypothetical protein
MIMFNSSGYVIAVLLSLMSIASCRDAPGHAGLDREKYLQLGDSLTRISFDTLRNTLLARIASEGLTGAVRFCKTEAGSLTQAFGTETRWIGRTSLMYRNPANKPDSLSYVVLSNMQAAANKEERPTAQLIEGPDGFMHYYKPIMMQAICLNCHGRVSDNILPEVAAVIDSLYPGDLARNYKDGDLRGAWHVRFEKMAVQ